MHTVLDEDDERDNLIHTIVHQSITIPVSGVCGDVALVPDIERRAVGRRSDWFAGSW